MTASNHSGSQAQEARGQSADAGTRVLQEVCVYHTWENRRFKSWYLGSGLAAALVALVATSPASAQTWVGGRSTPNLGEIVALDATGEEGWLFGAEDVAGDGLDNFTEAEQAIDIRSAYATSGQGEFSFRLYVSDSSAPDGSASGYVFIDADRDSDTGGTASAPEIDARFVRDTSLGGYEYVVRVLGNSNMIDMWQWDPALGEFVSSMLTGNQASAESGTDVDPVTARTGERGYLQGMINLALIELGDECDANLYFRSLSETAELGDGDLDVGVVGRCRPNDSNADGVPDLVVRQGCTDNDQCPASAVCVDRRCVFTGLCADDDECGANEECHADGYCVALVGDDCTENADCDTRRCSSNECSRCTADSQCDDGYRCGADGRCFSEDDVPGSQGPDEPPFEVGPEEEVQGGACTCSLTRRTTAAGLWLLLLPSLLLWGRRREA